MIGRLAISLGMFLEFCPCADGTPIFQGTCHVDSDMTESMGPEPYVMWATPRIPVGAPTLEIRGRKFGTDPERLGVAIEAGGPVPTIKSIAIQGTGDDMILIAQLQWPANAASAMLGAAKIVVTNPAIGPSKQDQTIQIVRPGFVPQMSSGDLKAPVTWQYLGMAAGTSALFFLESTKNSLNLIGYKAGTPVPFAGSPNVILTGLNLAVAAPASLTPNVTSTEIACANRDGKLLLCVFNSMVMDHDCSNVTAYGAPAGTVAQAIGSGPSDNNRELVAIVGEQKLYSCLYNRVTKGAPTCSLVAGFADNAQALWVGPLGAGGRADIVVLGQSGKLYLGRDDGSGIITDQSNTLLGAAGSWQALAVGEVDGTKGMDIVAVGATGITTWLNKGDGTFTVTPALAKLDLSGAMAIKQATLGDVDGDAKPDLVLVPSMGNGLLVALNLSDASYGSGRFSSPAAMLDNGAVNPLPLAFPAASLKTFDDGQANGASRRLLVTSGSTITAWDNKAKP